LLDLEFEEGKVPQLGEKAFFDVENPVDPVEFIERYKHMHASSMSRISVEDREKEEQAKLQALEEERKIREKLEA
jgi:hypothetical protein